MEAVITILALLVVVFIALGVYATVKAVGAAKRGVDRTITQARRTVEDTTLRAKSFGQPGVAGELAQLRLSLRTSMRCHPRLRRRPPRGPPHHPTRETIPPSLFCRRRTR
ncbi:hypothetical protein SCALM49S_00067 [Streptomyces californicus]